MGLPAVGVHASFRNPEDEVARLLKLKHPNKFLVLNLAEIKYTYSKFDDQVLELGWPVRTRLAPVAIVVWLLSLSLVLAHSTPNHA